MSSAAWGRLAAYLGALLLASWTQQVEAPLYRLAGTSSGKLMYWWQYALASLAFNMVGVCTPMRCNVGKSGCRSTRWAWVRCHLIRPLTLPSALSSIPTGRVIRVEPPCAI